MRTDTRWGRAGGHTALVALLSLQACEYRDDTSAAWSDRVSFEAPSAAIVAQRTFVLTLRGDPSRQELWVNGALAGSLDQGNPATLGQLAIGYSSSRFSLYDLVVYRRALGAEELAELHDYAMTRYLPGS